VWAPIRVAKSHRSITHHVVGRPGWAAKTYRLQLLCCLKCYKT